MTGKRHQGKGGRRRGGERVEMRDINNKILIICKILKLILWLK